MKKHLMLIGFLLIVAEPACAMEEGEKTIVSKFDTWNIKLLYESWGKLEGLRSLGKKSGKKAEDLKREFEGLKEECKSKKLVQDLPCIIDLGDKEVEELKASLVAKAESTKGYFGFEQPEQKKDIPSDSMILALVINCTERIQVLDKCAEGKLKIAVGKLKAVDWGNILKDLETRKITFDELANIDEKLSDLEDRLNTKSVKQVKKENKSRLVDSDNSQRFDQDSGTFVKHNEQESESNDEIIDFDTFKRVDTASGSEEDQKQNQRETLLPKPNQNAKSLRISSWFAKRLILFGGGFGSLIAVLCSRKIYKAQKKAHARGKKTTLDRWFARFQNLINSNTPAP